MSKMSFFDKLGIFFSVSTSSILYIFLILLLIFLGYIFFTTNKKKRKRDKIIYIACSVFILLFVMITYHGSLANIFDYMMNNLFIAIYFPNLAIYLAAIIITNIILWISLFHYKTSEIIKRVNIIVYIIMNYLLFLILGIINNNNLDVFTQSSVYGNEKASALIELSSILFIVWILFLTLYKIILIYLKKDYKPKVKKVIIRHREKILPENFVPLKTPNKMYGNKKTITRKEEVITPMNLTDYYSNNLTQESIVIPEKEKIKPILKEEQIFSNNKKELTEFDRLLFEQPESKEKVIEPIQKITIEEEKEPVMEEIQETVMEPVIEQVQEKVIEPIKEEVKEIVEETITPEIKVEERVIEEPTIEVKVDEKKETIKESIEQTLTIEDYKLLLRMLKEQKEKDRQEELRRQEKAREQDKFIELQALYGNVR